MSHVFSKKCKSLFVGQGKRANELLGLIHSDVCGLINVMAHDGYVYFVTFTDDLSGYGYVYLMKYKSEVFENFKEFKAEIEK